MSEFRKVFLPYCLQQQPDGRWILLNRNYKPVGMNTRDWVTYGDPYLVKLKGLGPATLRALSAPGSVLHPDKLWLYNDSCIPTESAENWRLYQERLKVLAKLTIVTES